MSAGNAAIGGGDPRLSIVGDEKFGRLGGEGITAYTRPQLRAIRDPNIKFEQYLHYAEESRAEEDAMPDQSGDVGLLGILWPSKTTQHVDPNAQRRNSATIGLGPEKDNVDTATATVNVADEEWINAQRAVRQASGAACFYLITTDVLGPFGLAYSFATVGWAPGIVLFTIFAVLAGYSGWIEWKIFMWTDSFRYPALTYGDLGYRIYGQWARIPINILQSIQLVLTVALITISNGLALSIVVKFNLCYVVCIVILVAVGMVLGQIRTLQKFGFLANLAVFLNVFIMILTMAVVAHTKPNYTAAGVLSAGASLGEDTIAPVNGVYPPINHDTGMPNTGDFKAALNGIMNTVFAYGGANIFTNFMAEMRRPRDFLKAMWIAQFFIWFVYMFYGLFLYGYQGQYSISPSPQTVSPYWAIVVANVMYIMSGTIAAVLYGNIGLKVIYNNICVDLFRMPALTEKAGKVIWIILIPIYWALAFVIGAVIPNFNALVGVVGAICIVQFTYSLPPLMYMGAKTLLNARLPGEGFDPATGQTVRHDSGLKRWIRGFTGGDLVDKLLMSWNMVYFLGALALGGLGAYASIEIIIDTFKNGDSGLHTFSCHSPLDKLYY